MECENWDGWKLLAKLREWFDRKMCFLTDKVAAGYFPSSSYFICKWGRPAYETLFARNVPLMKLLESGNGASAAEWCKRVTAAALGATITGQFPPNRLHCIDDHILADIYLKEKILIRI